jgi:hypothetical protein
MDSSEKHPALASIEQVEVFGVDQLARRDLKSEFNFETLQPDVIGIFRLFDAIKRSDLSYFPADRRDALYSLITDLAADLKDINAFDPFADVATAAGRRSDLIKRVTKRHSALFQSFAGPLALWSLSHDTISSAVASAQTIAKVVELAHTENQDKFELLVKDIEGLRESARKTAQEIGVSRYEKVFGDEADKHNKAARAWLGATFALAAGTVYFAWELYQSSWFLAATLTPTQSVHLAIGKIVILSILISAILWSGRGYRSNKHNAVINKHRQNALRTFDTFANSAGDQQTKSAVLLQTTHCIFSPQQSGYSPHDGDAGSYPPLTDLLKHMTTPKS